MTAQRKEADVMSQVRHTNKLIDCTSPYLLQHAHNPVEWYPWGAEALEKSRREGKPIFLSIGYAACHWCHVMEREVFEKPELAALMNEHFVNIKVDREERPDLDELYMMATQIMSGSGGWPMSVWLTPSPGLEPFYAGTYFPAEDGFGRPGFGRLTVALAEAWRDRREALVEQAKKVVAAIREHADETGGNSKGEIANPKMPADRVMQWARMGLEQFRDRFDEKHGGLGGAPKFPPHQALQFWVGILEVGDGGGGGGGGGGVGFSEAEVAAARGMVERTLDGMMGGGIYDQVGGGFARYSTDAKWLVPHFEKMLYDSAQLAPVYAVAAAVLRKPEYARVARETLDFFLREMQSEKGAFYSSLDADSEGQEGKYYVWTDADIMAAIGGGILTEGAGDEDVRLVEEYFGITGRGNWEESPVEGGNILTVAKTVQALAEERGMPEEDVRHRLDGLLLKMRKFREGRVRPGLDDKVLTGWNGLMVSALAVCGRVLHEPKYLEAAHRLIGFLLTEHMEGGRRLWRVSRAAGGAQGERRSAHTDAFLDDHAYLLNGLMDLIDSTTPTSLPGTMARKRALELADTLLREFEDKEHGGFYFTGNPPRHEALFARMKNAADNATPSANGVAIRALLRLAQVSGKEQYREAALAAVGAFEENMARRPEYFPTILLALLEDAEATRLRAAGGVPVGNALVLGTFGGAMAAPPESGTGKKQGESGTVRLEVEAMGAGAVKAGEGFEVAVRLTIAEGFHVQGAVQADKEAFCTVARVRSVGTGENVVALQEWEYPKGEAFDGREGYSGKVEFRGKCVVGKAAGAGKYAMRVTVMTQACTEKMCLAPERVSAEFALTVRA